MDLIISYIGLSQALFAVILILTKRPFKIAYGILGILLLHYAVNFLLDILQYHGFIEAHRWAVSLSIRMLYAPLFFLYSKYITKDYSKFSYSDLLHLLPSVSLILIYLSLRAIPENTHLANDLFYAKHLWLRQIYGWIFISLVVFYVASAMLKVLHFKRQLKEIYSYHSMRISLDWLLIMNGLFVLLIILIIVSSALYETGKINQNVYIFRHTLELFHVYVLSLWGFRQNQLISDINNEVIPVPELHEPNSGKYSKSGLKEENAKNYVQALISYMEETEIWKDPELSIAKLSIQTGIPKHQLSEVLNEYLGKSFYVFVNEYRVEYARKLLLQKKYANWSILAIAYECGFNSKTAFNNFFKKHTNLTPSEYKKQSAEQL